MHRATVGSKGEAFFYEPGNPVLASAAPAVPEEALHPDIHVPVPPKRLLGLQGLGFEDNGFQPFLGSGCAVWV